MIVAELELFVSRSIAPTRRVALGESRLPTGPDIGFGGVLLGGVLARFRADLDAELCDDLDELINRLERSQRVPQPQLRHRLQVDRIGLLRARHALLQHSNTLVFQFDEARGTAAQHVLAAVYAAARMHPQMRPSVFAALRRALAWRGEVNARLVAFLTGRGAAASAAEVGDPVRWALAILDLPETVLDLPDRDEVRSAFREQLREAHPDLGGTNVGAATRIADLAEARRILLGV